jgi:hypothetical protein
MYNDQSGICTVDAYGYVSMGMYMGIMVVGGLNPAAGIILLF